MRGLVTAVAVAALAAAAVWLTVGDRDNGDSQAGGSVAAEPDGDPGDDAEEAGQLADALADDDQTTPASLSTERARAFEQALNDRDPERIEEVVDLGDIDPSDIAAEAVPPGSELVIDDDTFQLYDPDNGPGQPQTGLVVARIVGDETAEMLLVLTEADDGLWLLAGSTEPQLIDR